MSWVWVMLLAAVIASLEQGVTGFGSGIMLMIILPHLLPIGQSAGVATLTMVVAEVALTWRYRQALKPQRLVVPFIVYSLVATWSVHLGQVLPMHILRVLLGCLLIGLAIYFLLRKSTNAQVIPLAVAVLFWMVSGFFNGLFGIGGPLMALYFLTLAKTKEEYLVSIQAFFLIDTCYVSMVRFATGVIGVAQLPLVAVGIVGTLIGTAIANRIVVHLNVAAITKVVYGFIGVSGMYYLLTALSTRG